MTTTNGLAEVSSSPMPRTNSTTGNASAIGVTRAPGMTVNPSTLARAAALSLSFKKADETSTPAKTSTASECRAEESIKTACRGS